MKHFFFLLITAIPFIAKSQDVVLTDGKASYTFVDSSAKATQAQFFSKATAWFADAFKSSKNVIQLSDPATGDIIGKGNFSHGSLPEYTTSFTFKISCRENKYRIQVYDIYSTAGTSREERTLERMIDHPGTYKGPVRRIDENIKSLIASCSKAMTDGKADNF